MLFYTFLENVVIETEGPKCPQCKMPYIIWTNKSNFLEALESGRVWYNRVLLGACAIGVASSVYIISFAYGHLICICFSGDPQFFVNYIESASSLSGVSSPAVFDLMRILIGIPLIPFAILGTSYDLLHYFYPALPFLLLSGSRISLELPPSPPLALVMLPFVEMAYRKMKKFLYSFVLRQICKRELRRLIIQKVKEVSKDECASSSSRSVEVSDSSIDLNLSNDMLIQLETEYEETAYFNGFSPTTNQISIDNTNIGALSNNNSTVGIDAVTENDSIAMVADESPITLDEITIVVHVKRFINVLFCPFAGFFVGKILFKRLPMSTFYRSLFGGAAFVIFSDAVHFLLRYFRFRHRISRKILSYPKAN